MHVGEQDRDLDVHREVDAGSADAAYMVQWLPLQSPSSNCSLGISTQPHPGQECASADAYTLVTKVLATSQLLQKLPLCQTTQIIFAPGQTGAELSVNAK